MTPFGRPEVITAGAGGLSGTELIILLIVGVLVVRTIRGLKKGTAGGFAVAGAVVGAILGFLFRPSVPLLGQLPLGVVITRGSSLDGLDSLVRPFAEQSFNYVVAGAILCAGIMGALRNMIIQNGSAAATAPAAPYLSTAAAPTVAASASGSAPFCTACGTPLPNVAAFCGKCGAKRS